MTVYDDKGRPHPDVGTGGDWWSRKTNSYAGCSCPPAKYSPIHAKPTNPGCPQHGDRTDL